MGVCLGKKETAKTKNTGDDTATTSNAKVEPKTDPGKTSKNSRA